jgi:hypothetical protein
MDLRKERMKTKRRRLLSEDFQSVGINGCIRIPDRGVF